MAAFTGQNGTVVMTASTSFAAVILNIYEWSLSIKSQMYDRTIFATTGGAGGDSHLMYRGPYQITGTLSLFLDDTAVFDEAWIQPGNTTTAGKQIANTLALYPVGNASVVTGKPQFLGQALLHGWTPGSARVGGLNTATVNFVNHNEWTMGVQ